MTRLDAFFTVKDAAEFLGVSENTVRNWGRDAVIPEYRHPVNNYRLFKRADLERLLRKTKRRVVVPHSKRRKLHS